MFKKILIAVMALVTVLTAAACTPGNGGDNPPPPPGPQLPVDNFDDETKPILMFLVDEGISDKGLIGIYGSDRTGLKKAIDNICEALEPLKENFRPTVLIYPQWYYKEAGWQGNAAMPSNRLKPELLFALSAFAEKCIPFYLEGYSSGIWTNQNGELGNLPLVPLELGGETYKSLPMDMGVVPYLKEEYGKWFAGIRFHELVGTNEGAVHYPANNHFFPVSEDVIRAYVDVCAENDLHLVWGDHSFNLFDIDNPSSGFAMFKETIDYAIDELPASKLTFNWSNNGWPTHQYFTDSFDMKGYRGSKYGMSVQDWFWQETDSGTMSGGGTTKWYVDANLDCPPEIMAAFCLRALGTGYSLIQFEGCGYMFNSTTPSMSGSGAQSAYELLSDYTMKLTGKRVMGYLADEYSYKPSGNLLDYYDSDYNKHTANRTANPAKRFTQNTLFGIAEDGLNAQDTYNNAPGTFYEQSGDRLREYVYGGEVLAAGRANLTFSATDEILTVKKVSGSVVFSAYNLRSGLIATDHSLFSDNANGSVTGIFGINLVNEYVNSMAVDSDEIVAVRKNGDTYKLEAYRLVSSGSSSSQTFSLAPLPNSDALITAMLGAAAFTDANFAAVLPIRTAHAYSLGLSANDFNNRKLDGGMIRASKTPTGITYTGKIDGVSVERSVDLQGEVLAVSSVDADFDNFDEIVVAIRSGGAAQYRFIEAASGELLILSVDLKGFAPQFIVPNRVGTYTKNW